MKYRAKCTYCIAQMCNTYPDRRKNPMPKDDKDIYIKVDTEKEADYIETINYYMRQAYLMLHDLEAYIELEKI